MGEESIVAAIGTADSQPADALMAMLSGAWVAQALFVVAKLGIADLLAGGPRPVRALAEAAGADASALRRVLRALATVGVFAADAGDNFMLTSRAEPLRSDAPNSLRAYAIMNGERWVWRSWGEIEFSVRSGQPAFEHVFGAPLFDYYARNPEAGRVSAEALTSLGGKDDGPIVQAYRFPATGVVADIGGGQGSLLTAILTANPGLRGVLLERPPVIAAARPRLAAAGLLDRCALVEGDFFADIPIRADVYLLRKVIHDWADAPAQSILARCRAAMPAAARLLLAERIVPEGNEPAQVKWLDLLMMVYAGGQERTEDEYRVLLAGAGFSVERVIRTATDISVIEARSA